MLNNIRIIKVACLIFMIFIIRDIYFYPKLGNRLLRREQSIFFSGEPIHFNNYTASTERIENQPTTTKPQTTKQSPVVNISHERYGLVQKYEQDKLTDINAPFKRILFWNDVRFIKLFINFI